MMPTELQGHEQLSSLLAARQRTLSSPVSKCSGLVDMRLVETTDEKSQVQLLS